MRRLILEAKMIDELALTEQSALRHYEAIIEQGLKTFIETGTALLAIRDRRLYRESHTTFEDYCQERWGISRPRAYQLIEAVEVTTNLSTIVDALPANEAQIRPLTRLEPEQQRAAWQQAVETAPNSRVTAAHVERVVDELTGAVHQTVIVPGPPGDGRSVTYRHQSAIQATHGNVPLGGTLHAYTVTKQLWPEEVENLLAKLLVGKSLHVCCGKSQLGDVRLDLYEPSVDIQADAARLPLASASFDTVLCDPPYNGIFQWNHDMLTELARVARQRIIFQHWFVPGDPEGYYKKANVFQSVALYVWQSRTYFGRAQIISVFDFMEV